MKAATARNGRPPRGTNHYLLRKEFEEYGCRLKALNVHGGDTPERDLTDGILDQIAKYERAKTTERTRRG
jgi:DNA invertase Pin-like site-specific DNA recombinase